jgi:hypothetical protein
MQNNEAATWRRLKVPIQSLKCGCASYFIPWGTGSDSIERTFQESRILFFQSSGLLFSFMDVSGTLIIADGGPFYQ